PDIVFLDIELPRKTGFELIDEVNGREVYPTFILITAYSQYAIRAIRARAFDYLLKPVLIDELKEAICRFVEKAPGLYGMADVLGFTA
ncbi:MAG: LytR/AlgR family response regulator transcription factor, partial [Candidatus Krumholzibacteriia bacterium]